MGQVSKAFFCHQMPKVSPGSLPETTTLLGMAGSFAAAEGDESVDELVHCPVGCFQVALRGCDQFPTMWISFPWIDAVEEAAALRKVPLNLSQTKQNDHT